MIREHRRQNLGFGDGGGIAGEKRLNIEGLARLDDEMNLIAGNVDARHLVDDFLHLSDDEPALESRRLYDRRGVLGVGAGIEIAVGVCAYSRDQGDVWGQVYEVAGEELQVGVNRAEFDLTVKQHPRDPRRLWP